MNNEKEFRQHAIDVAHKLHAHVSHVESHETSAGIPDLNLFMRSTDLWLELKIIRKDGIKMRPPQKRWHLDRYEAGGMSWVLVYDPKTDDILTVPGEVAACLDHRESSWRAVAAVSNIDHLSKLFLSLAKRKKHGHSQHTPDSHGTPKGAGEPARPLPPGGKDVGEYHWLTDPARTGGPVHGGVKDRA